MQTITTRPQEIATFLSVEGAAFAARRLNIAHPAFTTELLRHRRGQDHGHRVLVKHKGLSVGFIAEGEG